MASPEQLELRKKWVEALRSGKYKQTRKGYLKTRNGGFCCLGVLCEVEGLTPYFEDGKYYYDTGTDEECMNLPYDLKEKIGLNSAGGIYNGANLYKDERVNNKSSLVELNDETTMNFNDIADFIESNPDGMFKDYPTSKD